MEASEATTKEYVRSGQVTAIVTCRYCYVAVLQVNFVYRFHKASILKSKSCANKMFFQDESFNVNQQEFLLTQGSLPIECEK